MEPPDVVRSSHEGVYSCQAVPSVRVAGSDYEHIVRERLTIKCSVNNNLFKEAHARRCVDFVQKYLGGRSVSDWEVE